MSVTSDEMIKSKRFKNILLCGGLPVLLLLLSSGFVFVIYSTIGFIEQIYVIVVVWIIQNLTILPGFDKIQEMLKFAFRKDKNREFLGYLVYVVVPPLLFNGLLYQFRFVLGLIDFVFYIVIPVSIMVSLTVVKTIYERFGKSYWVDISFILFYFYTFDARLFKNIFNVFGDTSYNILSLYMISILVYVFIFLRDRDNIGFNLEITRKDILPWISNLAMFTIIAIPLALATGFITPRSTFESPLLLVVYFIGIFLTIAMIEEFAFRGALLNFIEKVTGSKIVALAVSAIIFGVSHYNNMSPWDLRYIVLATIAGIFYGLAYLKQRRLLPAILVHTSVDTIWKYFFY